MAIDANLALFVLACIGLNLTPGADMLYTITAALRSGPRAGLAANFGIAAGLSVHVLAAALGLAALFKATPQAFEALRWAGVAWLIWLGVQALGASPMNLAATSKSTSQYFRAGFFVNLLNPKTIIFILAFLPQFAPSASLAELLILGVIFITTSTLTGSVIALFAASLAPYLARSQIVHKFSGLLMFALAARLALERN